DRRRDSRRDVACLVPLHDVLPGAGGDQTRRGHDAGGRCQVTAFTDVPKEIEDALERWSGTLTRRTFLKGSGLLVVSVGAAAVAGPFAADARAQTAGPYADPDFRQLDSWIVIHENNTATFAVGKTDCGQGTGTSFRQMMSDELDIAY